MAANPAEDPRFVAAVKLIGRTGAKSFQIRYDDSEQPVVWMAVGEWLMGKNGRPVQKGTERNPAQLVHDAAGAMDPLTAVLRLLDQIVDGGICAHCGKPTGVTDHWESDMPLAEIVCWYVFDPEMEEYRRSCGGDS